jgi:hypothetical protein
MAKKQEVTEVTQEIATTTTNEVAAYNAEINNITEMLGFVDTIDESNFVDETNSYLDIQQGVQYTFVCHGLTTMKDTINDSDTPVECVSLQDGNGSYVNADVKLVSGVKEMINKGKEIPCIVRFFWTEKTGKDPKRQYKNIILKSLALAKLQAPTE